MMPTISPAVPVLSVDLAVVWTATLGAWVCIGGHLKGGGAHDRGGRSARVLADGATAHQQPLPAR
jgi:hypothetical protein